MEQRLGTGYNQLDRAHCVSTILIELNNWAYMFSKSPFLCFQHFQQHSTLTALQIAQQADQLPQKLLK